jgi:hypothetical protein
MHINGCKEQNIENLKQKDTSRTHFGSNHFTSESLWLNQHHQSIYFAELL